MAEVSSLKEKRQIVKRVVERTKNRFNVSAAEVGSQDIKRKAVIGIAVVGSDGSFVNSVIDKVINFIESMHLAEIVDTDMEIMRL